MIGHSPFRLGQFHLFRNHDGILSVRLCTLGFHCYTPWWSLFLYNFSDVSQLGTRKKAERGGAVRFSAVGSQFDLYFSDGLKPPTSNFSRFLFGRPEITMMEIHRNLSSENSGFGGA